MRRTNLTAVVVVVVDDSHIQRIVLQLKKLRRHNNSAIE